MDEQKKRHLNFWDILIITALLLGQAIYTSTLVYLTSGGEEMQSLLEHSVLDDMLAFLIQSVQLLIALAYLKYRKFDFSLWRFKCSWESTLVGVLLFILLASLVDIFCLIFDSSTREFYLSSSINLTNGMYFILQRLVPTTVLYACLNGVFEEVYFCGMCLAVNKKYRFWIFLFSLIVRISFHTYQGTISALAIGLVLGPIYYIWYEVLNHKNLYPIFLSHALADIFGLGLLNFFI